MKTKDVMTVTLDPEVLAAVKTMAAEDQRSLSNMVNVLLKEAIERER